MRVFVIGQGYVGLTIAMGAASVGHEVTGFDINGKLVEALNSGNSHIEGLASQDLKRFLEKGNYLASANPSSIGNAEVIVIAVPTPLTEDREPDLTLLRKAVQLIQDEMKESALIINESTSFPGTLRKEIAGRIVGIEHLYASSPERVDPGNNQWNTKNTPRLIGGLTPESVAKAKAFYLSFCDTVIEVSSPEVAEAAKTFENTFRQVNIALVNEFIQIADALGISGREVIEAAATKPFGFMKFTPGPGVGGHCIPIDPTYLAYIANEVGVPATFIKRANEVNLGMPSYVVKKAIAAYGGSVRGKSVVVVGVAYKPNVSDTRETPAAAIVDQFRVEGAIVSWNDPLVSTWRGEQSSELGLYDLAIVVTKHDVVNIKDIEKSSYVFDCTGSIAGADGI